MPTLRFFAIKETFNRVPVPVTEPARRSEIFGKNVFNTSAMRQYLTKDSFKSVMDAIETGAKIERHIADHISTGMKEGYCKRRNTLYALVPAINRSHGRKTRCILRNNGRWPRY